MAKENEVGSARYELYYWPSIPGRGEFVRLVLEEAGASYVDVGRQRGAKAVLEAKTWKATPCFAPPILRDGDVVLSQMPLICRYVGEVHGLAPARLREAWRAMAAMLTISDALTEVHNVHHPVSTALPFEEQSSEAVRAAHQFVNVRLNPFVAYFHAVLVESSGPFMMGDDVTYVDLALDQLLRGLDHSFPRAMAQRADLDALTALREVQQRVAERARVQAYRKSERCIPFSEHGIFRYYDVLDVESEER